MKLTAEALAYAMNVLREAKCPLSRVEAQGMIAEAYLQGMSNGIDLVKKRVREWQRQRKS